jgi:cellulose synthase/poly-beta-1,6-N-acetylglucosamine synthase-like glycosyltransferase
VATALIVLVCLSVLRRIALTVASLLSPRRAPPPDEQPTVRVLVAAHDEGSTLPGLLDCLDVLLYPADRLSFVLVNDGSRDCTPSVLNAWCAKRSRARVIHLQDNVGKAVALEIARQSGQPAELTAVYDADVRPEADALTKLAEQFVDPRMGAAGGSRLPSNANTNLVSRYAGLELYVFDLVIQAARQRLGWNPPAIGANCMYRSVALDQIGGFPPGAISEDLETSFALLHRGWRTSHRSDAVVTTPVPTTLRGFWRQRQRWTRGMYKAGWRARRLSAVPVAAGYADRLILLAAFVAALLGTISFFWPLLYLLGPCLAILIALRRSGEPVWVWFILACPPMFVVDVSSTLVGTVASLRKATARWVTARESWGTEATQTEATDSRHSNTANGRER